MGGGGSRTTAVGWHMTYGHSTNVSKVLWAGEGINDCKSEPRPMFPSTSECKACVYGWNLEHTTTDSLLILLCGCVVTDYVIPWSIHTQMGRFSSCMSHSLSHKLLYTMYTMVITHYVWFLQFVFHLNSFVHLQACNYDMVIY